MVIAILACEIGFWTLLGLGLFVRYGLRRQRASTLLLLAVPLVDVALLVASIVDLRRGTAPNASHSLAAVYLGFTVAFGHDVIRWADRRAAHRYAGAPLPPAKPAKGTRERACLEWRDWAKAALGYVVTVVLLAGMALAAAPGHAVGVLFGPVTGLGSALTVWLFGWPVYYSARARAAGSGEPDRVPDRLPH